MFGNCERSLWSLRILVVVSLTILWVSVVESAEPSRSTQVPTTALRDLLQRDVFKFSFLVKQGAGAEQRIIARPTIISSKTGGYAIESTSEVKTTVSLPPAHLCEVKILDAVDEEVTVEFQVERTVGLLVTESEVTWETQHHRTKRRVSVGQPVTLRIPKHQETGDPPVELMVVLQPFDAKVTRR